MVQIENKKEAPTLSVTLKIYTPSTDKWTSYLFNTPRLFNEEQSFF